MVLIGIGNAGANLVGEFGSEHKKFVITHNDFPKKCSTTEEYEKFCPNFSKKLKFREKECWVVLSGAGKVSGCALRVLETIKNKKVNIIYIMPDLSICNIIQSKRNRVVFNVLQEYTRSGLLNSMYLFSNKSVLDIVGDQPITTMYNVINKQIANAIETIQWFSTQTPTMGTWHEPKEISRICTVSVGNFKKNDEKMYFPIDNITETGYIYSISKTQLEKNKELLNIIKEKIAIDKDNDIASSFVIYSSEHKQSFYYSIKFSHVIQTLETK